MDYHVFKKTRKLPSGKVSRHWYYYYLDDIKRKVQKACKGCKTRREAEDYIRKLPGASRQGRRDILIREIAGPMFLPGSAHMSRREQLGRSVDVGTMKELRGYIVSIIKTWGDIPLADLDAVEVVKYLFKVQRSASWKKRYLTALSNIYDEAMWYGLQVQKPAFQKFTRHSRKAAVFTSEETTALLKKENFPEEMFFLFFLLCLSAGLRLGEVRAVRVRQVLLERRVLIVDGFCKKNGERTCYNKKGSETNPKFRVVMLPSLTVNLLSEYIAVRGLGDEDFLFTIEGKPVSQESAERVFVSALVKAGIAMGAADMKAAGIYETWKGRRRQAVIPDGRRLVVHSLRYTYVTRMRRELPVDTVSKMVGHASAAQTDYYTDRSALEEAIDGVSGAGLAVDKLFS